VVNKRCLLTDAIVQSGRSTTVPLDFRCEHSSLYDSLYTYTNQRSSVGLGLGEAYRVHRLGDGPQLPSTLDQRINVLAKLIRIAAGVPTRTVNTVKSNGKRRPTNVQRKQNSSFLREQLMLESSSSSSSAVYTGANTSAGASSTSASSNMLCGRGRLKFTTKVVYSTRFNKVILPQQAQKSLSIFSAPCSPHTNWSTSGGVDVMCSCT